jgi:hypothetical protein
LTVLTMNSATALVTSHITEGPQEESVAGSCPYLHGEPCPCCMNLCLDPREPATHELHIDACVVQVEVKLQKEAALAASADVACSICYEVVVDKPNRTEARFGVLPGCDHAFCLGCIREWRSQGSTQVRACPMCRHGALSFLSANFPLQPSSFQPGFRQQFVQRVIHDVV